MTNNSGRPTAVALFLVLFLGGLPGTLRPAAGEVVTDRYALVIGNSRYQSEDWISGVKDADLMTRHLKSLGFEVVGPVKDGDLVKTKKGLSDLEAKIRGGASAVIVFFSGHGFQSTEGKNYLMPIDGTIDPATALSLDTIQSTLSQAPDAVKLVFLDACRSLKEGPQGLNASEAPSLRKTLYAFAAGTGQTSAAGSVDGFSPYSMALLRHLREPGLNVIELLGRVSFDLKGFNQLPAVLINGNTNEFSDFYLQPPVIVKAEIKKADDSLVVILDGKVAMSGGPGGKEDLRLKAGENDLELMVYNDKALHNGQTWGRTEGWNYELQLRRTDGTEVLCRRRDGSQVRCFEDEGEGVPFKTGPRHGKLFKVARAKLLVGVDSPTLTVEPDLTVWRDSPVWANDQGLLDARSLRELQLTPEDLLQGVSLGRWEYLRFLVVDFLTSGKILGREVTDPNDTLFTVRGNRSFEPFVKICMTVHRADRIRDLRESVVRALDRDPTPFVSYDRKLSQCIGEVGKDSGFKPEDMLVWTAVETRRSLNP